MAMADRWFLAIWPDAQARTALERQVSRLGPLPGRATHPLDWHLTLVFLGELAPERLACVETVPIAIAAHTAPFEVSLTQIDRFPHAQVLWCGPDHTPEPLAHLVADLQSALAACGIVPESRPYRPHLTLARRVRAAPARRFQSPITWTVRELVLAFGIAGARPGYRIQRRYPCGAP
ncbi:RNA 2',3'-cyclic phosphodiesterase [Thermochromatium tepidum]|uniref:RNA 2',3'-cyclic phosphodiesterase n=1 Tax=Thermochromatium tepidum ATCC 43061 TaxID=316276 RepID=A0A6I6EJB4_THETI|nr:RNA 2',3'-cyclic phosphodiesterase [Thermochromatium tepidum]QGU33207.1 RNA 2',3'-cyclic phosphodiesterase [Thermochromatium tepidum ATCC 43061]